MCPRVFHACVHVSACALVLCVCVMFVFAMSNFSLISVPHAAVYVYIYIYSRIREEPGKGRTPCNFCNFISNKNLRPVLRSI